MKYAFVERHRRSYEVKALCDALQVSRSGHYAARGRAPSARQQRRTTLTAEIRKIPTASRETYGAPRVHAELSARNVPCCRNTVAKLMRQAAIMPKSIRRVRLTIDSRRTKASPNLIRAWRLALACVAAVLSVSAWLGCALIASLAVLGAIAD